MKKLIIFALVLIALTVCVSAKSNDFKFDTCPYYDELWYPAYYDAVFVNGVWMGKNVADTDSLRNRFVDVTDIFGGTRYAVNYKNAYCKDNAPYSYRYSDDIVVINGVYYDADYYWGHPYWCECDYCDYHYWHSCDSDCRDHFRHDGFRDWNWKYDRYTVYKNGEKPEHIW